MVATSTTVPIEGKTASASRRARVPRWLPRVVRNYVVRRAAEFPRRDLEGISVEVVTTVDAYLDAFALVHDAYVERGWLEPQPSGLWVTPHHLLPDSTVLLLRRDGVSVGCVALIEDSSAGLPVDHTFAAETAALRRPERKLIEIGSLAVARGVRRTGVSVALMAAMWRHVYHCTGATELVASVSASVVPYYEAFFDFRAYTRARDYVGFRGAAALAGSDYVVGLHQDVCAMQTYVLKRFRRLGPGDASFNVRSLGVLPYPAFFEVPAPELRDASAATRLKLPREVFQELCRRHPLLVESLDEPTRERLLRLRSRETVQGTGISAVPRTPAE